MRKNRRGVRPAVLSIAGLDPSAGAGLLADLKVFTACGAYGLGVASALTIQSPRGVSGLAPVSSDFLARQVELLLTDFEVAAVKVGMVLSRANVEAIARILSGGPPMILDPVLASSGGVALLRPQALETLKRTLLIQAELITPNAGEAALLSGIPVKNRRGAERAAEKLKEMGAKAVFLKGGHLPGPPADLLLTDVGAEWLEGGRRIPGSFHGTGCALSSAIAAYIARGYNLKRAARQGQQYLRKCMAAGAVPLATGDNLLDLS